MGGAGRRETSLGSGGVAAVTTAAAVTTTAATVMALVEEEEEEEVVVVEEEDGGGIGVVASGEALDLPSGSEERAEDRDGGCRYLPPPSLQLVTSEHKQKNKNFMN